MYDGGMMGWGWWWLIGVLLFVLLIAVVVIAVVGGSLRPVVRHDDALEALRLRYARGEIDRTEYDERRQALTTRR